MATEGIRAFTKLIFDSNLVLDEYNAKLKPRLKALYTDNKITELSE